MLDTALFWYSCRIANTGISLNVYYIHFNSRYKKVHAYLPAERPGGKLRRFNTGIEHSDPPHNLTIIKVNIVSKMRMEDSLNLKLFF